MVIVKDLAGKLYVVIGELADLSVVDTEDLGFLRGTERKTWDKVHDSEDDAGATEGVDTARDGVCQLVAELHPVVVEPAAVDV